MINYPTSTRAIDVQRHCGAWGDGFVDDTAAIQLALDLASFMSIGSVYFPKPRVAYSVTSSLRVHSNTMLFGDGWGTGLRMDGPWTGTAGLFVVDPNSINVSFRNLYIDCVKASKGATTNSRAIYIPNAVGVTVENCFIIDPGAAGIDVVAGGNVTVSGCRIIGGGDGTNAARSHAIGFAGNTAPNLVNCSAIRNYIEGAMDTGIGLYTGVAQAVVLGNIIKITGLGGHAIDCVAPQGCTIEGNTILLSGNALDGIYLHPHTVGLGIDDVTVVGNTIDATGTTIANGIVINGMAVNLDTRRLTLIGNVVRNAHAYGIYLAGGNGSSGTMYCVLTGNIITGSGNDGLLMSQAGGANVMTKNVVTGNVITNNGGWGINFGNNVQNGNSIHDNILTDNVSGASTNGGSTQVIS